MNNFDCNESIIKDLVQLFGTLQYFFEGGTLLYVKVEFKHGISHLSILKGEIIATRSLDKKKKKPGLLDKKKPT